MTSSSSSSSYSASFTSQKKYDVFLSKDRFYPSSSSSFARLLCAALRGKKKKVFIDEEHNRGNKIPPSLFDAIIEGARISLIIFSKDYASSERCLNELVQILECKKVTGQLVIPIFYDVLPSDVRKQTGSFGEAFVELEKNFKEVPGKVQEWRAALTEASYLPGYESMTIMLDAELADQIVKDISKKLEIISVWSDSKGLVVLDSWIGKIKTLLRIGLLDFQSLGIWGVDGVGKTTIAESLFKRISEEFEGKCFIKNVREKSEQEGGLEYLEKQVLSQLLEENIEVGYPNISQDIKERLQHMKVLIVLDDVSNFEQLEYLAEGFDRFGPGSGVIVTTRDKQLLTAFGVHYVYEVEELNRNEAFELFYNYAFRKNKCPQDLITLSSNVVDYANGNPLLLKVLGSSLHQKSKPDWEDALSCLRSELDFFNVLKISYDLLDPNAKNIFLDIACFFRGEDKDFVTMILDNYDFVHDGLRDLIDKSLITVSQNNKLEMHDLLRDMGREIVLRESVNEPWKRSRLWHHEDVCHVLKNNTGTERIEGIFLDMSKIRYFNITSQAFTKMPNLRLLKFYMPEHLHSLHMNSKVHLHSLNFRGLVYLPKALRYLHWYGYPLKSLPSSFTPENLVALDLPYSKLKQLWKGKKEALTLKYIDLRYSQCLVKIADLSKTPNLERIYLLNCTKLPKYMPSYFQNLNNHIEFARIYSDFLLQIDQHNKECNLLRKYKKPAVAVLFFVLEAISVVLDRLGNKKLSPLLASFILSAFGFAMTIFGRFVDQRRQRTTRLPSERQLGVLEVVFSVIQLIVSFVDLILAILNVKKDYDVSVLALAFSVIGLVFAFKRNEVDSVGDWDPYQQLSSTSQSA